MWEVPIIGNIMIYVGIHIMVRLIQDIFIICAYLLYILPLYFVGRIGTGCPLIGPQSVAVGIISSSCSLNLWMFYSMFDYIIYCEHFRL